jgi:hypothetical protein
MSGRLLPLLTLLLRIAVAAGGGYAFANILGIALARYLPLPPAQAVLTAMLVSFLAYALAAIWVFTQPRLWLACLGLLLPTALGAWWLWPFGGGPV